jgi:hypothetical protein
MERIQLLHDIEAEYSNAVQTRTIYDEKTSQLLDSTALQLDTSAADKKEASFLLQEISQMEEERCNIETSLAACTSSLMDCQHSIDEKITIEL